MPKPDYDEPVHIPATPEELGNLVMNTPPKPPGEWKYLQDEPAKTDESEKD